MSTDGLNEATIRKYMREQEKRDMLEDKPTAKEYDGPFKGSRSSVHYGLNIVKASVFSALAFLCPFRASSSRPFHGWS